MCNNTFLKSGRIYALRTILQTYNSIFPVNNIGVDYYLYYFFKIQIFLVIFFFESFDGKLNMTRIRIFTVNLLSCHFLQSYRIRF